MWKSLWDRLSLGAELYVLGNSRLSFCFSPSQYICETAELGHSLSDGAISEI